MDFCTEFPQLEPKEREAFQRVVARLMAGRFVTAGSPLSPDADWRFLDRHHALIDSYLDIGGWRLEHDPVRQVSRVVHPLGEQRVLFDRLESICLLLLRLAFHEQMSTLREGGECSLAAGELREQLIQRGYKPNQVSRRALERAVRHLARAGLVEIELGFRADDREKLIVRPVIESVVSNGVIDDIAAYLSRYEVESRQLSDVSAPDRNGDLVDIAAVDGSGSSNLEDDA